MTPAAALCSALLLVGWALLTFGVWLSLGHGAAAICASVPFLAVGTVLAAGILRLSGDGQSEAPQQALEGER